MKNMDNISEQELTRVLTYAGFVLVAFELTKSLIVNPIKSFYKDITFTGMPFKSYKEDVLSRHNNEFEACLLYLRDFMKVIDSDDVLAIQALREHRNELAHDLPNKLCVIEIQSYESLFEKAKIALFKLSNHNTYIEIGADPRFKNKGINWDILKGPEYLLFEEVLDKVKFLQLDKRQ